MSRRGMGAAYFISINGQALEQNKMKEALGAINISRQARLIYEQSYTSNNKSIYFILLHLA